MLHKQNLVVFAWGIAAILAIIVITDMRFSSLKREFLANASSLNKLVSQRADQHDALLTGLSALASANKEPLADTIMNMAETISKFYPRIEHIDLIQLDSRYPEVILSTRSSPLSLDSVMVINIAAYNSDNQLKILPTEGGYFLVKRSPNSENARYALTLFINAEQLIDNNLSFNATTQVILKDRVGEVIYSNFDLAKSNYFSRSINYSSLLGSQSQPLTLELKGSMDFADYIRWQIILPVLLLFVVGWVIFSAFVRQRKKTLLAEERASLGEHEARIAQASRINGLGEMASGLAHEITQPLTAILSQSQAGIRLIKSKPNETEVLEQVLYNITQQAKRGGDIVKRLRNWTTHEIEEIEHFSLNSVAESIRDLMKADMKEKAIKLEIDLCSDDLIVEADRVAIEQVCFNLARNAVDALDGKEDGILVFTTRYEDGYAIFSVKDNGKGIENEHLKLLFQPFYSTKHNGMGLGLSLCESILDRYNGQIEIANNIDIGVTAVVRIPVVDTRKIMK